MNCSKTQSSREGECSSEYGNIEQIVLLRRVSFMGLKIRPKTILDLYQKDVKNCTVELVNHKDYGLVKVITPTQSALENYFLENTQESVMKKAIEAHIVAFDELSKNSKIAAKGFVDLKESMNKIKKPLYVKKSKFGGRDNRNFKKQ